MKRRNFIGTIAAGSGLLASKPAFSISAQAMKTGAEHAADVVIAGGGLGGVAAALGALRNGMTVVLTEETDWIGGQIAQQGVPPDEHQWIETHGAPASYRAYRSAVREYYLRHYPLTDDARSRKNLNPGDGSVSRICHEPRVALAVLLEMLNPHISSGKLLLLTGYRITGADVTGDRVRALRAVSRDGREKVLKAPYFIDATELGDLLPLTKTEYVTGSEARSVTGELHAQEKADPNNHQAFTMCFAMDYVPGSNNVIDRPEKYAFWRDHVPDLTPAWSGKLLALKYTHPSTLQPRELGFHPEGVATGNALNLWNYRRIISRKNFRDGAYPGDITIVNWPQNDYMLGGLIDVSEKEFKKHVEQSKQLSLSLFYWLQTEAPRPDGGQGWPGLRLRGDVMGTEDGMAKYPYIRESRRIRALFTVLEEHVGAENRAMVTGKKTGNTSADFFDSVGIGYYHIDLHPSTGGNNYIDFGSLPFQIPLGALIPQRVENLLPANKNIGTTHITNGCYRLHPVEWSIGEAAGMLASYALKNRIAPRAVREDRSKLEEFQQMVRAQGVETHWPS